MHLLIALLFVGLSFQPLDGKQLQRTFELYQRTNQLADVDPELILPAVTAALTAETDRFPAELLLAVAWGESRFISSTHTGKACGIMQTIPSKPDDCRRWLDPVEGFKAGVAELIEWSRDARTHNDVRTILLAYACGNQAFDGTCIKEKWPDWVLARARRLGMRNVRPLS
jgi:hypothetical protein